MIVVYAGRRPSGEDGPFPASREEYLRERVERMLAGLRPTAVVGSAAAGSDVLILEVATRLEIPATVVIAGDVESFAAASVEDHPGWRARFDAVLQSPLVDVDVLSGVGEGDAGYRAVTQRFLQRARDLRATARSHDPEAALLGLILSGGDRGAGDHTEDLRDQLEAAGQFVLQLDPRAGRDSSPLAFVAMPFGERRDPTHRNRRYQSDETWNRLLLPALLDAGYRPVRTDAEATSQLIDGRMVRNLLGAELVVVDLATLNANVFWELGVRHTARARGTLMIAPVELAPPFDIRAVPVHRYRRDPGGVSDTQVVEGLQLLRRAIRAAEGDRERGDLPDSPVHAAVPGLRLAGIPLPIGGEADWLERIVVASEVRDGDRLMALVADAARADLPGSSRNALRVEAARGLVRLWRHREAVEVLRPVVDADTHYDDEPVQQLFAHALIRAVDGNDDREDQLRVAEHRLRVLATRYPGSGETLGLLGSAVKERAYRRHVAGQDATAELRFAADVYRRGFRANPVDYYPGVNAVGIYRLLGQRLGGDDTDVATARELLPVVRFAVNRLDLQVDDVWAHATLGELALQEHLLDGTDVAEASRHYSQAAAYGTPQQLASMLHQLEIMLAWGDPPPSIEPLVAVVRARAR